MKNLILSLLAPMIALMFSCASPSSKETIDTNTFGDTVEEPISVKWKLYQNMVEGENKYKASFTFTNNTKDSLQEGWTFYMSRLPRALVAGSVDSTIQFTQINGDFYSISPSSSWPGLAPGESREFTYIAELWAFKYSDAPCGGYFIFDESAPKSVDIMVAAIDQPEQYTITQGDNLKVISAAQRWEEIKEFEQKELNTSELIIPSPRHIKATHDSFTLSGNTTLVTGKGLASETAFLAERLETLTGTSLKRSTTSEKGAIQLILNPQFSGTNEAYALSVKRQGVQIEANSPAGIFYGIQSFIALIPIDAWKSAQQEIVIPTCVVEDEPRFAYRGMMLDAGRNFHSKASVIKLLDAMALYKLNKFHFHFSDDEGWRLEIKALPELTEVGSQRGHTLDESDRLFPAYGSGPTADSDGSGYYSQSDFVEILKYAKARHIEIIPEIDIPGHARAAITSMKARYHTYKDSDPEKALQYRLDDPQDKSEYLSVQQYSDNVICICQESSMDFLNVVLDELTTMYSKAGAPFTTVHIGGDEVPVGVWEKSPKCEDLIASRDDLNDANDLKYDFLQRMHRNLSNRGLTLAGWEEIGLHIEEVDGKEIKTVNPTFAGKGFQPHSWNTVFGWGAEDVGYKLANAGYQTVLSNVTNLYFDLAPTKDPEDPGYYWGGLVDLKKVYEFTPMDLYKIARYDRWGHPIDPVTGFEGKERLTAQGKANIQGIQGQLWSETVKGQELMERYLLPRLIALGERAWAPQPAYARIKGEEQRENTLNVAYETFLNQLGQRELPRLDFLNKGYNYRLPYPGGVIEDGTLHAHAHYPGLALRYTTDGSEPSTESPLYEGPVAVSGEVKVRNFTQDGRGGRVFTIK